MQVKRDLKTNAIINTDAEALNKYKLERTYYRKVDKLQEDIIEIKKSIVAIYERIEKMDSK